MTSGFHPLVPAQAGIHDRPRRKSWVPAFVGTSGIFLAAFVALTPAAAAERVVNFYNWSDYIAPTVFDAFTRETGIKVRYDTFDGNDTLEAKLFAGQSGYDVVVPTAYFLAPQIEAGLYRKLDKSKLPNLANAWPEIANRLAVYDPDVYKRQSQ